MSNPVQWARMRIIIEGVTVGDFEYLGYVDEIVKYSHDC